MEELDLTHPQFVDVCILAGCDYAESIKGIGEWADGEEWRGVGGVVAGTTVS